MAYLRNQYHIFQGYAGGDEAKMLQRHLLGRPVKIGIGANRAAIAASFLRKYGYVDPRSNTCSYRISLDQRLQSHCNSEKIGAAILDDGMQVTTLFAFLLTLLGFSSCLVFSHLI